MNVFYYVVADGSKLPRFYQSDYINKGSLQCDFCVCVKNCGMQRLYHIDINVFSLLSVIFYVTADVTSKALQIDYNHNISLLYVLFYNDGDYKVIKSLYHINYIREVSFQ